MTCPQCQTEVARVEGVIEEPVITRHMVIERRARPAVYWVCSVCEWCGEEPQRG